MTDSSSRRAQVIGTGMVGGSIAAALRAQDWHVAVSDVDTSRAEESVQRGFADLAGIDDQAEITFIATPVSAIADQVREALERGSVVTDVGSVKGPIDTAIRHGRFVGGHPMAGSEKAGLDGVNPELFRGATWVLTPSETTHPDTYMAVRSVIADLGASVVTVPAAEHDDIVAIVSHVPHLAASALMNVTARRAHQHEAVLRLSASGFRDMTRIAAGDPSLWTDISLQNRQAIIEGIGELLDELTVIREQLVVEHYDALHKTLAEAAVARAELPLRAGRPRNLTVMRIPIPDAPGSLGKVLSIYGDLRVNVEDMEIAHDPSGTQGVLQITVATEVVERVRDELTKHNFHVAIEGL